MDNIPAKKPKLEGDMELSIEEKQNPIASTSQQMKQSISKARSTLRNMDSTGKYSDLTTETETEIIGRASWILNNIQSDRDLDGLANHARCVVGTKKFRLRFYFDKLDMTTEAKKLCYLSLCVAAQNGGNHKEALTFTVKVDRLTEEFKFDFNQMPEREVKIVTPEDYNGVLVDKYFLNYDCSSIATSSMNLGITVTIKIPPKVPVAVASMLHDSNTGSPADNLLEMTMTAKDNVQLDAMNFMLAARSQVMMTKVELDKTEQDFDAKAFLQSILDWIYLGKISGSTGKVVHKLLEDINTRNQVMALRWRLEEEVWMMNYPDLDNPPQKQREPSLRVELGKHLTMKRINGFIYELTVIIGTPLPDD